jgi:DNA-binding PadR family transcriptional regulator
MVLTAFLDGPAHGYEVIRRLQERTEGRWRPSAGSVYPTLQWLEEAGFLHGRVEGEKKIYELTKVGRARAREVAAGLAAQPLDTEDGPVGSARGELREAVGQLHIAARQVGEVGDRALIEQAATILAAARHKLYQLLAES